MIHAWGITDKGAVRTQNQDGFYVDVPSEHLAVGVVCDGMGGAKAGNIASLLAVETFVETLQNGAQGDEEPPTILAKAAEAANTVVYHRACTEPDCRGMGTTMVAVLMVEHTAYLLNIGDSRAYHMNEEQGITRLTRGYGGPRGHYTGRSKKSSPKKFDYTRPGFGRTNPGRPIRKRTSDRRFSFAVFRWIEQHRNRPGDAI